MNKVIVNKDYGTFCLPKMAVELLNTMGIECDEYTSELRDNPIAVSIIEAMLICGYKEVSHLKIVEIPGRIYRIESYDGKETLITPNDDWVIIDNPTLEDEVRKNDILGTFPL